MFLGAQQGFSYLAVCTLSNPRVASGLNFVLEKANYHQLFLKPGGVDARAGSFSVRAA
jgi:hypothetical protein